MNFQTSTKLYQWWRVTVHGGRGIEDGMPQGVGGCLRGLEGGLGLLRVV